MVFSHFESMANKIPIGKWVVTLSILCIGVANIFAMLKLQLYYPNHDNDMDLPSKMLAEFGRNHRHDNDEYERIRASRWDGLPYSSLLPQKLYTIVGLESSGTRLITATLSKALGLEEYRPANGPREELGGDDVTRVQHVSLPWGCCCDRIKNKTTNTWHPINGATTISVLLPGMCNVPTQNTTIIEQCAAMAKDANVTFDSDKRHAIYPQRFLLDLVASKEFYKSIGVEQIVVVVTRDQTIRRKGVVGNNYCRNETLLEWEEVTATNLLRDAIRKYILGNENSGNDNGSRQNYQRKSSKSLLPLGKKLQPPQQYIKPTTTKSLLPSANGLVLVSYESLMALGDIYIELLYHALGIDSDHIPDISDGNQKYVDSNGTIQRTNPKTGGPLGANLRKLESEHKTKREIFRNNES